jgi:hypothetical protein
MAGSRTLVIGAASVGKGAHNHEKRNRASPSPARVNMLGRLVFTTVGPLTLGLLFAAYSPPAHAVTITVFGTPGTPGVDGAPGMPGTDGGPGGDATATTPPNNDPNNTANAIGGNGGNGGAGANGGIGRDAAATAATSTAAGVVHQLTGLILLA